MGVEDQKKYEYWLCFSDVNRLFPCARCPPSHFRSPIKCQRNAINKLKSIRTCDRNPIFSVITMRTLVFDSTLRSRSETMDFSYVNTRKVWRVSYKVNNKVIGVCEAFSSLWEKLWKSFFPITKNHHQIKVKHRAFDVKP